MLRHLILVLGAFISFNLNAQEKFQEVQFDEKFIDENKGKTEIEVNELKELIHIMIAITEVGLDNDNMVDQTTVYYDEVLKTFLPFKEEAIIGTFDSLMVANPLHYIFLTGNALSYEFNKSNLVPDETYLFPAQSVSSHTTIYENPITIYKEEIEAFAKKSKFRKFYKKHQKYYDSIAADYNEFANLQKQWNWLEKQFDTKVDNYVIMCSPLIYALNYTTSYTDNGFKQIMMVLPPVEKSPELSKMEKTIDNTRFMFTEIDHNYVGNPTQNNIDRINEVFKDRDEWVNSDQYGTEYYPTPERVFDEYMTFGVFLLYCRDHFDKETLIKAKEDVIDLMVYRGFPKMEEFTEVLFEVRAANTDQKIEAWYPVLIDKLEK